MELPAPAVSLLLERTEGWAAGLRLAALSLAGHPDPARFAAEFSGNERTVAEYLLAEVLERETETACGGCCLDSMLERVNGELADLLTGDEGGERILQDLEAANAFVVSLNAARTWFRYHQLFADLLKLELRRAAPGEVTGLYKSGRRVARRGTGSRWRRSGTPRPPGTGDWPHGSSPLLAQPASGWAGCQVTNSWPDSRRPARSCRAGGAVRGGRAGPGVAGGGGAVSGLAERKRRRPGRLGAGRSCSGWSGCSWPASAGTPKRYWRKRNGYVLLRNSGDGTVPLGEDLRAMALTSLWLGITEIWATGFEEAERTWSRASRWHAGSDGRIWSSAA